MTLAKYCMLVLFNMPMVLLVEQFCAFREWIKKSQTYLATRVRMHALFCVVLIDKRTTLTWLEWPDTVHAKHEVTRAVCNLSPSPCTH